MISEVSLLGSWEPATSEERLDRLESLAAIHQLAVRYALAVDSRDLDTLVALFAADVKVGKDQTGREALQRWFARILKDMRVTVHFVGNHVIDFDDPDRARGVVYCQDEMERPITGEWHQGRIQYWDDYRRVEGQWFFTRRRFNRWYLVDALERPGHGRGVNVGHDPLPARLLPDGFETWDTFWAEP
jgi:hypothetical protein